MSSLVVALCCRIERDVCAEFLLSKIDLLTLIAVVSQSLSQHYQEPP